MSSENLEEKIITVARQVFIEKGYENASMSDIASRVGINRPTLHYYYRTKERLFQAIFHDIIGSLLPRIQETITSDCDFFDKISFAIDQYITTFKHNPFLPAFIVIETQRDIKHIIQTACELHLNNIAQQIAKTLNDEMEAGRLRKVKLEIVFSTFYGLLTFPFIGQNLLKTLLLNNSQEQYETFLQEWKQHVITQMRALLAP